MNETNFASYADDNTPYKTANTIDEVLQSLEHDSTMLIQWFSYNQIKANISKCHLLVNKKDEVTIRIGDKEINNSEYEKLVEIKVDRVGAISASNLNAIRKRNINILIIG